MSAPARKMKRKRSSTRVRTPSDLTKNVRTSLSACLRDPEVLEEGEKRQTSLNRHGVDILGAALEALGNTLSDHPQLAARIVVASGVLKDPSDDTVSRLRTHVQAAELADRLSFLKTLREMGVSEEEWRVMTDSPRKRGSTPSVKG